jgi:8-oxo-dGTP diphosphatase
MAKYTYDYPRPAVTVDIALVTREPRPRILLIRRKHDPFAGTWALPGGFADPAETLAEAALRELREETGVTGVDLEQLAAFGDPGRDPRGWTVSVAFLARVDPAALTPRAADDADAADWYPLDAPPPLAFDHAKMLDRVRARLAAFAP